MNIKKALVRSGLGVGTVAVVLAGAAAFSAFESHIINVTARIENGLSVDATAIDFGTVFPQEYITHDVNVALSDSFLAAPRVDDISYTIKQKPKVKDPACGHSEIKDNCNLNPTPGDPYSIITVTGFDGNPDNTFTGLAWQFCEQYLPPDSNLTDNIPYTVDTTNTYWQYCYLPLANDLSKHSNQQGDQSVDAFHQAYVWTPTATATLSSLDPQYIAIGHLVKPDVTSAIWTIDLKVPCFVDACAQEAFDPNNGLNDTIPGFYVPSQFQLDPATEHDVFGTDLWIEVTGVSTTTRI